MFVGIGGSVNTTLFTVTDGDAFGFHGSASSVVVGLDTAGNHYGVAVHGLAASVVGVSAGDSSLSVPSRRSSTRPAHRLQRR